MAACAEQSAAPGPLPPRRAGDPEVPSRTGVAAVAQTCFDRHALPADDRFGRLQSAKARLQLTIASMLGTSRTARSERRPDDHVRTRCATSAMPRTRSLARRPGGRLPGRRRTPPVVAISPYKSTRWFGARFLHRLTQASDPVACRRAGAVCCAVGVSRPLDTAGSFPTAVRCCAPVGVVVRVRASGRSSS